MDKIKLTAGIAHGASRPEHSRRWGRLCRPGADRERTHAAGRGKTTSDGDGAPSSRHRVRVGAHQREGRWRREGGRIRQVETRFGLC
jgi:hypothetical protein